MARGKRKTKRRFANLTNIETGEFSKVLRGTREYNKLKKQGYLSREQMSHRTEYKPDFIESPPEENTDYPEADERELLKERIEDMLDTIQGKISEIPDDKLLRHYYFIDLREQKQMFFSMIDDLYAQAESDDDANYYLKTMYPTIADLVQLIIWDSTQEDLDTHLSLLATVLQRGTIDLKTSEMLGRMGDYDGGVYGWYEQSSRFTERM